jgi:hypothetical protein
MDLFKSVFPYRNKNNHLIMDTENAFDTVTWALHTMQILSTAPAMVWKGGIRHRSSHREARLIRASLQPRQ